MGFNVDTFDSRVEGPERVRSRLPKVTESLGPVEGRSHP